MVFPSSLLFIYNLKSKPKLSHCHVEIIKQQKTAEKILIFAVGFQEHVTAESVWVIFFNL